MRPIRRAPTTTGQAGTAWSETPPPITWSRFSASRAPRSGLAAAAWTPRCALPSRVTSPTSRGRRLRDTAAASIRGAVRGPCHGSGTGRPGSNPTFRSSTDRSSRRTGLPRLHTPIASCSTPFTEPCIRSTRATSYWPPVSHPTPCRARRSPRWTSRGASSA